MGRSTVRTVGTVAGYSDTPLVKLGIKDGHLVALAHAPKGWTLPAVPGGVKVVRRLGARSADVVIAFVREQAVLHRELPRFGGAIRPDGALWIAWPRRAGGHESDMTDNAVRDAALPIGLVDVKVAALDRDWSALKMVWRKELRPGLRAAGDARPRTRARGNPR